MPNDKPRPIPTDEELNNMNQSKPIQLPGILGRGEDYINNKVIQPFRQGLDTIGTGLQADSRKPGLTPLASGLEYGLGSLTKAAPVGHDLRSTIGMALVPPELGEETGLASRNAGDIMSDQAAQVPKQTWIEKAGAEYKGSMPHPKGGDLHYFNDPKTGSTLAMRDNDIKSHYDVKDKMEASRKKFARGSQ